MGCQDHQRGRESHSGRQHSDPEENRFEDLLHKQGSHANKMELAAVQGEIKDLQQHLMLLMTHEAKLQQGQDRNAKRMLEKQGDNGS